MLVSAGLLILSIAAAAVEEPHVLQRFESQQRHMGVSFRIVLYAPDETTAKEGFAAAFARISQLDRIMSDYDPSSELSRLSRASPTVRPVKVSDDLWQVLGHSQRLSERTKGAFDITVGPLTRLWRRARRQKRMPSEERLSAALAAVGYEYVKLDSESQSVELLRPGMRLDLGGIAKGFAADEALSALRRCEIRCALINASGDIVLGDAPPGQAGWVIGIAPLQVNGPPSQFLRLSNCSVATSGDAWQFVEIDGQRYSHIIDPQTGLGLKDRSSVTMVAPTCTVADGMASAVSVLGPVCGLQLVEQTPDLAACVIHLFDGVPQTCRSRKFEKLLATSVLSDVENDQQQGTVSP